MMLQNRLYFCLALLVSPFAQGSLINGDFSSGLAGWTIIPGDVTEVAGEALVADDGFVTGASSLYQGVPLATGNFQLSFDFLGELSSVVLPFPDDFPDFFAASLYFIDAPLSDFDLVSFPAVFDDVIDLFDLDHTGLVTPISGSFNGSPSPSPTKPGWIRWTVSFSNGYDFAIPTFETFDGNFDADSQVRIDNVSITSIPAAVPLPSSLLLLLLGLSGLVARRGKMRTNKAAAPMPVDFSSTTPPRSVLPSGWG